MAKVVNLRQARKAAQRDAHRKAGDENAARHGLSRAERQKLDAESDRAAGFLNSHRVDRSGDDDGD